MTAEDVAELHRIVDALTVVASLSVMAAIGWYMTRMRGRVGGFAGPTAVIAVFLLALATTRVIGVAALHAPGAATVLALLQAAAAAVAVVAAVAMWPLVPRLLTLPTRCELVEVNRRLEEEQAARQVLVEEMRGLNEDLERRVAARTRDLELERHRFRIALSGSTIAVAEQDRDLRYTWMYNPPPALSGLDPVGRLPEDILPAATAAAQNVIKRRVIATGRAERFEVSLPSGDGVAWYEGRIDPLIEEGAVTGVITVAVDITRHKNHEREMRDLLRELTHRSKNLLAVVQGIARQSGSGRPGEAAFLDLFNGRLQALSRVHEILVEELWRGVDLCDLIERERASGAEAVGALRVSVPDRRLSPEAAQNFALALHELFVDARHAAAADSTTEIAWSEIDGRFVFLWRRSGPPGDTLRDGFGRVFLERHLPRAVGGRAALSAEADATHYRLEGPLTALDPT